MTEERGFRIEVTSRCERWRNYDVAMVCGCFDAEGRRTAFVSARTAHPDAPAGASDADALPVADAGAAGGTARLSAPDCHHAMLYLYVIPRQLPESNDIETTRPFDVTLRVAFAGRTLRTERLKANQWSGLSLELRLDRPEE